MRGFIPFALLLSISPLLSPRDNPLSTMGTRQWEGVDNNGRKCRVANSLQDKWSVTITVGDACRTDTYTKVTDTSEYLELQRDADKDQRVRIYKDKVCFYSRPSGALIGGAKGKWTRRPGESEKW